MLKRFSGQPKFEQFTKTASTVMRNGNVVALTSGQLTAATGTSTSHVGILIQDILTTDADYAVATRVLVDVPTTDDIFLADVKSGVTAVVTNVGIQCDLYVDSSTKDMYVDTGTTSHKQVTVVGFVSASQVLVKINSLTTGIPAV